MAKVVAGMGKVAFKALEHLFNYQIVHTAYLITSELRKKKEAFGVSEFKKQIGSLQLNLHYTSRHFFPQYLLLVLSIYILAAKLINRLVNIES